MEAPVPETTATLLADFHDRLPEAVRKPFDAAVAGWCRGLFKVKISTDQSEVRFTDEAGYVLFSRPGGAGSRTAPPSGPPEAPGTFQCGYCGTWSDQAYKGPCPNCPPAGMRR